MIRTNTFMPSRERSYPAAKTGLDDRAELSRSSSEKIFSLRTHVGNRTTVEERERLVLYRSGGP